MKITDEELHKAVGRGDVATVRAMLDGGALAESRQGEYTLLIHAMYGRYIARDRNLVPLVQLLIERGAPLDDVTRHGESALSVASANGRFDVVRVLLDAGADPAPLQWTLLHFDVVFGSLRELEERLKEPTDLRARDFWSRTPWLLSLQVGDVAKAKLLLDAGASRGDRGRCGKTPLMYPIHNDQFEMLQWLLAQGFAPDDTDEFGDTALKEAAGQGAVRACEILIGAGADANRPDGYGHTLIFEASNLETVHLLLRHGADINGLNDEMRAALTGLPNDGAIDVSREEFETGKHRRFGNANPEKMNDPFWRAMVRSGADAFHARSTFGEESLADGAIWCFRRFGKSITLIPDGRIIEIAGEHEDHYDPDFCIYNDVIVHDGHGNFDIYGYPKELFPPTDFHSATLVGSSIYVVGGLGYKAERALGQTQVFRLDISSLAFTRLETSGESPGWISRHRASYHARLGIKIQGGKVCSLVAGKEAYENNVT